MTIGDLVAIVAVTLSVLAVMKVEGTLWVIQEVTRSEVEVKPKVYNRSNQKFTIGQTKSLQ